VEKSVDADGAGAGAAVATRFAYDGWNPAKGDALGTSEFDVWADLDGSSSLTTRYVRGDQVDQLFARLTSSDANRWYLVDHQGSVRNILDNGAASKDALAYDAFGNIVSETNSAERGRYGWTSREIDTETGLQYNRARYYDAATGRWISQDPMGFDAGDSNLYRYARNLTVVANDPSGLDLEYTGRNEVQLPVQDVLRLIEKQKFGSWKFFPSSQNSAEAWIKLLKENTGVLQNAPQRAVFAIYQNSVWFTKESILAGAEFVDGKYNGKVQVGFAVGAPKGTYTLPTALSGIPFIKNLIPDSKISWQVKVSPWLPNVEADGKSITFKIKYELSLSFVGQSVDFEAIYPEVVRFPRVLPVLEKPMPLPPDLPILGKPMPLPPMMPAMPGPARPTLGKPMPIPPDEIKKCGIEAGL
jgi:RHS repeat-associated protein